MSIYINKDIHETLDYVFVRTVDDNITSVSYVQDNLGGLVVESCLVNAGVLTDSEGNTYPAARAIIMWVSGGVVGATEKVRLTYSTSGGRTLDEEVVFKLVEVA